jgi:hypothetical protein
MQIGREEEKKEKKVSMRLTGLTLQAARLLSLSESICGRRGVSPGKKE